MHAGLMEQIFSVEVVEGVASINEPLWRGPRRRVERLVRTVPGVKAVTFKD
jgi:hypothetical protein